MALKIIYKNITEETTKIMFNWYGQELKIECKNLEIRNLETDEKISVINNYNALFEQCEKVLSMLLKILDIDLLNAWDIYYSQERFANINNWEEWEGIESIEDLDLKITKYDDTKKKLEEFVENTQSNFVRDLTYK